MCAMMMNTQMSARTPITIETLLLKLLDPESGYMIKLGGGGQLVMWPCWGGGGGLRVGKEAPERHEKGEAELEEPERDDEGFAPWRMHAQRAGGGRHRQDGLEAVVGSN